MTRYIFPLILILSILTACSSSNSPIPSPAPTATIKFQLDEGPTAALPTAAPPTNAPPTSTSVMDHLHTPTTAPTATLIPGKVRGLITGVLNPETVVMILDGDSLKQTYVIRLLGVDAPLASPTEPWSVVAVETLDKWLANKIVRIEQDKTIMNKQDELPRYLYLEDELINLKLIELGLARPRFEIPDTKLKAQFEAAAQEARAAEIGLWGPDPTATPVPAPSLTITATMQFSPTTVTATSVSTVAATPVITPTPAITATSVVTAP